MTDNHASIRARFVAHTDPDHARHADTGFAYVLAILGATMAIPLVVWSFT
jgi:hypothetical protein